MNPQITVIGSTNLDITATVDRLPGPGETLLGSSLTRSPGGKGANQALAASRAGASVRFITAVGEDVAAGEALALLAADGVDLTDALVDPGQPTGTAIIAVDARGENNIIVIPGANGSLTAPQVTARAATVSGVVVLQGEIPAPAVAEAARVAPGRVVLNLAPVIAVPEATLLAADPLVVNEHEGALVLAQLGGNAEGLSEEDVVAGLRASGVRSVVMTLGSKGALVSDEAGLARVPSVAVAAVDATGAGDAFVGALAARLAEGAGLAQAAAYAARFAADTVTRPGAQASYPARGAALPGA